METTKEMQLFEELLIENGEPFYLENVHENLYNAYKDNNGKKLQIYYGTEEKAFIYGDLDRKGMKFAKYNSLDEEDLVHCIEKIIVDLDKMLDRDDLIHRGDIFHVKTNAELLNAVLNKHYKGYMKCAYLLNDDFRLLMLKFDEVTSAGWLNREMEDGTIIEQFVGDYKYYPTHEGNPPCNHRAVFEKKQEIGQYIFRGVYELSEQSSPNKRIWKKISDTTNLVNY